MNLPTKLTISRIWMCVFLVTCLEWDGFYRGLVALILFSLASLTDWLDGYLARKWKQETDLGRLLDPLADKILIVTVFICLVARHFIPMWIVVCIISREFLITGLRSIAAAKGAVLSAERAGKHKTISQMVTAIAGLILLAMMDMKVSPETSGILKRTVFDPLVGITLLVTIYSGLLYFKKNVHHLVTPDE
jgi:CDP-diacylglycerol--glycerol-3-phosphate 3-phosphatidyltransferase